MARLTAAKLRELGQREITLKRMSEQAGEPCTIVVRKVRAAEWLSSVPMMPPGAEAWPREERVTREQEWLRGLPEEERQAYRASGVEGYARLVKMALLDPVLPIEDVKSWGDDLDEVVVEILRFSGLLQEPEPVPALSAQELQQESEPDNGIPEGVVVRGRLG